MEFAQIYRRFGSQVTIVQKDKQLLTRDDADVAEEVAKILREDGIEVLLEANTLKVEQIGDGETRLTPETVAHHGGGGGTPGDGFDRDRDGVV